MVDVIIRAQDLHKHFGALHVLRGVNLETAWGEVVVIIGPSGSGKRHVPPVLGSPGGAEQWPDLAGGDGHHGFRADLPQVRRPIGMVFQHFNLFPHRTALENVMQGPRTVLRLARDEARSGAQRLLAKAGLATRWT
jgi:ABC-type polar amino acid transport system ATPase subunit